MSEYGQTGEMNHINEVFLSVTALSCFGKIVFDGSLYMQTSKI